MVGGTDIEPPALLISPVCDGAPPLELVLGLAADPVGTGVPLMVGVREIVDAGGSAPQPSAVAAMHTSQGIEPAGSRRATLGRTAMTH